MVTPDLATASISSCEQLPRQPVLRDAHGQHAAGHRKRFENGDLVPPPGKEVRRGQAGRTSPDDGDVLLVFLLEGLNGRKFSACELPVAQEPFDLLDRERLAGLGRAAPSLAVGHADSSADDRQRIGSADDLQGFPLSPLRGQTQVRRYIRHQRAQVLEREEMMPCRLWRGSSCL